MHRGDGFEIDRKGVQVVAGQLLHTAADAVDYDDIYVADGFLPNTQWPLPVELHRLMDEADELVHTFWRDLHSEVGMAGLLIDRAATNYKLGDDPRLGDLSSGQRDKRLVDMLPGNDLRGSFLVPSMLYPSGGRTLKLSESAESVGPMTAAQALDDISDFPHNISEYQGIYEPMADSLVELAHTLRYRAQDLCDAPWQGVAAENAQSALRRIYANATALAAIVGSLFHARARFLEITDWCRRNFEQMADPERGGWDEFWDGGGTADSRARSFLEEANKKFKEVGDMLPKQIKEDLPGLMVTDAKLVELRLSAVHVATWPQNSKWDEEYVATWQENNLPVLQGYERAEETYG
ncbi:hypothetical protein [Nonomuraea sp. NPDC002799]